MFSDVDTYKASCSIYFGCKSSFTTSLEKKIHILSSIYKMTEENEEYQSNNC